MFRFDLPQIVAPIDDVIDDVIERKSPRARRASFLPRSNAIESKVPRKQTSSPLPQQSQRIYDRGHVYSRSWNTDMVDNGYPEPEGYRESENYREQEGLEEFRQHYHIQQAPPRPPTRTPTRSPARTPMTPSTLTPVVPSPRSPARSPIAPPSRSPIGPPTRGPQEMLSAPRQSFSKGQARSFDAPSQFLRKHENHHLSLDQRSFSEQNKKELVRQMTVQLLQPESNVSRDCQTLWQERKKLENRNVLQQVSIDFSDDFPSAASTSFESNTESVFQSEHPEKEKDEKNNFLEIPKNSSSAEIRRQKYKNLLQNRNRSPKKIENSSFESAGSDSTSGNKFGSSLDSVDLPKNTDQGKYERYRSLIHSPKKQPNMQRQIANRTFSMKYATQQPRSHVYASFDLERDYSVDSKSDSLFRSFSRVDPQYYQFRRNELKYPPKKEPWYPKEFNPKKEVRYPPKSELPYSTEFNQNQRNHGFQNSYKSPEDSYFH